MKVVAPAATVFALVFAAAAVLRHRAFESGRFDLGNMTQAVWSTAHGDVLSVTDVRGEQISRLGAHFDPILAALAPLWWVWPSPEMLLVVQAVAVASGSLPVFMLARRHFGATAPAAALAVAYLLLPPVQWLTMSDFHPVALACPLLLFAWCQLDGGRLWAFALLAGLAVVAKEHVGLAVAGIGAWYALRGHRRAGAAIAVTGALAALVAVFLVVPHFAPAGHSAFESRYDAPAAEWRDLRYVATLLWPLALLPLAAPLALAAAVPEVALNVLSSTATQTSVRTHYAAVTVPALVVAATFGARRLGARSAYGALAAAAVATVVLGPLGRVDLRADERDGAARRALTVIPDGAPVTATNALGAHLSDRERIFSFPVLAEADWAVVDTERLTYLDSLDGTRSLPELARLRREWRTVFSEAGILVLRRP